MTYLYSILFHNFSLTIQWENNSSEACSICASNLHLGHVFSMRPNIEVFSTQKKWKFSPHMWFSSNILSHILWTILRKSCYLYQNAYIQAIILKCVSSSPSLEYRYLKTYLFLSNSQLGFLDGSMVKNPPAKWEMWIWPLGLEDPLV